MIRTLVVDDDFRVAEINAAFVARTVGFEVVGRAHTARTAVESAASLAPDLVLLDLYLPDAPGLAVLSRLRSLPSPPDVIVVTAARDIATVRTAQREGAIHYLVKPFDEAALAEKLSSYRRWLDDLATVTEVSQDDVDRLYTGMVAAPATGGRRDPLPDTVRLVVTALREAGEPLGATQLAERLGISRPTVQRYLVGLHERGEVVRDLRYGSTGRPSHRYRLP